MLNQRLCAGLNWGWSSGTQMRSFWRMTTSSPARNPVTYLFEGTYKLCVIWMVRKTTNYFKHCFVKYCESILHLLLEQLVEGAAGGQAGHRRPLPLHHRGGQFQLALRLPLWLPHGWGEDRHLQKRVHVCLGRDRVQDPSSPQSASVGRWPFLSGRLLRCGEQSFMLTFGFRYILQWSSLDLCPSTTSLSFPSCSMMSLL